LERHEYEMQRMREDPWYRQLYRMERGLRLDQYVDRTYVEEKETGMGTRPYDYLNPDYRAYMDHGRGFKLTLTLGEALVGTFWNNFDPKYYEDLVRKLEEEKRREEELRKQEEARRAEEERMRARRKSSGGIFGILKRIFNFSWWW
jgi:hypothetical protein